MRTSTLVLALSAATAVLSCGDSAETTPEPEEGVTFSGVVKQALLGNPLNGVQVCIADPPGDCATTDDTGAYTLPNIPKNTHVEIHVTSPGFLSALGLFDVKDVDRTDVNGNLLDEAFTTGLFADAGVTLDTTKGAVVMVVSDPDVQHGASGYSFTLSPAAGEGPFYISSTAVLPTATETTDVGGVSFINLPEGEYTLEASGPGGCTTDLLVSNGPTSWPARVRPGFVTYLLAECPDGPDEGAGGAGGASGTGGAGGG